MYSHKKIALILNNSHPCLLPDLSAYDSIWATDGAYDCFKDEINFTAVIGDFDSLQTKDSHMSYIHTPNQSHTDFEKALAYLDEQGYKNIDVFNASGGEQDHFLGNLNAAMQYHHRLNICFYDEWQYYFYVDKDIEIQAKKGQKISLFPFPYALISSYGLVYEMEKYELEITRNIGIRNQAIGKNIRLTCHKGGYFLFITHL